MRPVVLGVTVVPLFAFVAFGLGCGNDDEAALGCVPCEATADCAPDERCVRYKSMSAGEFQSYCIEALLPPSDWPPCTDCLPPIESGDPIVDDNCLGPCEDAPTATRGIECEERCAFARQSCRGEAPTPFCNCLGGLWPAATGNPGCACDVNSCFDDCVQETCLGQDAERCERLCLGMCRCDINSTCPQLPSL